MRLLTCSALASLLTLGCGTGPTSDPGGVHLSLVGDGDRLRLLGAPADPGYSAEYNNPRDLSAMDVEVLPDGEFRATCSGPSGATACSEPPFFTAVEQTADGRQIKVWDHHGVLVADAVLAAARAGDDVLAPDAGPGGDDSPGDDDCEPAPTPTPGPDAGPVIERTGTFGDGDECEDGGDDGDGDGDGDGDDPAPQCEELHESSRQEFCERINDRLEELGIDHQIDCELLADDVNLEDLDVDPPDIELGCDDIIDEIEDDLEDEADDADCDDVEDSISVWETNIRATLMQEGVCGSSPLVLDVDGDGIELSSVEDGARFDLLASGQSVRTAWPTGGDAFLVLDRNGNGAVDSAVELFGNATGGQQFSDGFAALARLDDNGDRRIDASDGAWTSLRLWHDGDRDGASAPGELRSLASAGVASLDLESELVPGRDEHGNRIPLVSSFTRSDGSEAALVDAFLRYEPNEDSGGANVLAPLTSLVRSWR